MDVDTIMPFTPLKANIWETSTRVASRENLERFQPSGSTTLRMKDIKFKRGGNSPLVNRIRNTSNVTTLVEDQI